MPNEWRQLGGTLGGNSVHPFNTTGTGAINLLELGAILDEGEHLLEFRVGTPKPSAPPIGGKVLYNLYIE